MVAVRMMATRGGRSLILIVLPVWRLDKVPLHAQQSQAFHPMPHLLHCAWDDAAACGPVHALHGVCLARTRLAVRKEAHVVPVQSTLHQLRHPSKHLLLAVGWPKHTVIAKGVLLAIHVDGDAGLVCTQLDHGARVRLDTAVHTDL